MSSPKQPLIYEEIRTYEAPRVVLLGTIHELTQGSSGAANDANHKSLSCDRRLKQHVEPTDSREVVLALDGLRIFIKG
jgi:hypothetical protein